MRYIPTLWYHMLYALPKVKGTHLSRRERRYHHCSRSVTEARITLSSTKNHRRQALFCTAPKMPDYQHWIQENIVSPAGAGRRSTTEYLGPVEDHGGVALASNSLASMATRSLRNEGFSERGWKARDQLRTFESWAISGKPAVGLLSATVPLRPAAPSQTQGVKSPRRKPRQQTYVLDSDSCERDW